MENKEITTIKYWVQRIFSLQSLGFFVALGSLLIGAHQLWLTKEGTIAVCWEGEELLSEAVLRTYVYSCNESLVPMSPLLAKVENHAPHAVRDLSVRYTVDLRGLNGIYHSDYKWQSTMQGTELRNEDRSLPAHEELMAPIEMVELQKVMGRCMLSMRLSYNGLEEPFTYQHNFYIKQLGKRKFRERAINDFLAQKEYAEGCSLYLYDGFNGFVRIDVKELFAEGAERLLESKEDPFNEEHLPQPPELGVLLN
ncbi:MAG: hypothetical protein IKZ12_01540 [Alistipes sp.]|nr:hypothetical protein [Alistipes sp.]